jgi:hypothetical protein
MPVISANAWGYSENPYGPPSVRWYDSRAKLFIDFDASHEKDAEV